MAESDYIIHLGDNEKDINLYREFSQKIFSVAGNCDGGGSDKIIEIEGLKILLTHGDKYRVKSGITNLFFHAKEIGVNVVMFGHTHSSLIEEVEGITFINPGTLKGYFDKSYCYAVIYDGKITAKIVNVN
jgi:putative phosphoesterase